MHILELNDTFYSTLVGEWNIAISLSVCLSTSISLEPLDRSIRNLVHRSPVAVAWSSSGSIAIQYVLPVMGRMAMCGPLNL